MSDTTALSHEYSANADFAKQVNLWLLALKKAYLEIPQGTPRPEENDVEEARQGFATVLSGLITRLEAAQADTGAAVPAVPEEVYQRIEAAREGQLAWFLQDLKETRDTLCASGLPDDKLWQTLEEIADAADASASASFRRLWRRKACAGRYGAIAPRPRWLQRALAVLAAAGCNRPARRSR
jgi:hypothetical protein